MSTVLNLTASELATVATHCLELLKVYAHSPAFALNPEQGSEDIKDISTALYNAVREQVTQQDLSMLDERTFNMLDYNEQTDAFFEVYYKHIKINWKQEASEE